MSPDQNQKELREAIAAGERALESLRAAQRELDSASNWGVFDMVMGGVLSTWMKRSRLREAQQHLDQARTDVQGFRRELADLDRSMDIQAETGDFLHFADYFFDGLIVDWMVQSKINQAKLQTAEAIRRVQEVLAQLQRCGEGE